MSSPGSRQGHPKGPEGKGSPDRSVYARPFISFLLEVRAEIHHASSRLTTNRSGTPLIYRAIPVWFVRLTPIIDELVANNKETRW